MQPDQARPQAPPRAVAYGALSVKKGDDESIDSQVEKVRARLAALYPEGVEIVGVFEDDGVSGSKKSRGPGLSAAITAAVNAAPCELWANTAPRFARGQGGLGQARALGALYYELKAKGVVLRCAHEADDAMVRDEMLVGIASRMAAKYSEDLSESVTRAKRRQAERGEHLGGKLPIGYVMAEDTTIIDEQTAPIVRRIFELADQGLPDAHVARALNAEGVRTRLGRPFDRRAIQAIVTNAYYSGRIAYDGDLYDGQHPAVILPTKFDAIQRARPERDLGEGKHVIGRPIANHALAKMAICGKCGERLYTVTSTYTRTDGSRRRTYVCHSYKFSTGLCDAGPIDAEIVDSAVVAGLDHLLIDFDSWRQRIEAGHHAERQRLADEVARAERDLTAQADRTSKVEQKWTSYIAADDDHKAELVLPIVEREREALGRAELRLTAARDALASIPVDVPADDMLDFANALQEAISGRIEPTDSLGEVNRALRELFECFLISTVEPNALKRQRSILIQPVLRMSVAHRLTDEWPALVGTDEAPPLRWIDPERISDFAQVLTDFPSGLPLPVLDVPIAVGQYQRTLLVEPLHSPVPAPLAIITTTTQKGAVR